MIRLVRPLVLPVAVLCALALPSPAAAVAKPWTPDVDAARGWAKTRPGQVAFAIRSGERTVGYRATETVAAASLMKTLFLVAHLRRGDVRDRPLRAADRALLAPMIRRSDDVAATTLRNRLGDVRLRRLARTAGLRDLVLAPIWGSSRTSARDQVRLFARLRTLLPPRHREYALGLLASIVPSQRWGIAQVGLPGWRVMFKGGWGSGSGAVDHQAALLERDGRRIVVAVTTTGNGSHAEGKRTLRGVFARLLDGLR